MPDRRVAILRRPLDRGDGRSPRHFTRDREARLDDREGVAASRAHTAMTMLDDWGRVKAVFEQALTVDEAERPKFLAAACGSDVQLRERVDALLASHAASESFLEGGASSVLRLPPAGDVQEDLSGQTLGT